MTLRQALREGGDRLCAAGVPDAALDAWYLLEHVSGMDRAHYYAQPDSEMDKRLEERFFSVIELRSRRIPLQHIVGEQMFMGLPFVVNEHVLIPRQDTETLVESVLDYIDRDVIVLDVCTGSGCVILSIEKLAMEKKHCLVSGTGTDISEDALRVAEKNRSRHGLHTKFMQSDMFEKIEGKFDVIVSNPPYIENCEIPGLQPEVRMYEPETALAGGEDGLDFYRILSREAGAYLNLCGGLFLEIGNRQGHQVSKMLIENGFCDVKIIRDLAGEDRVVTGIIKKRKI